MMDVVHRLRLPWIVAWIVGFFLGQWILVATGWVSSVGSVFVVWRILAVIAAYIVLMVLVDMLWKRGPSNEPRSLAREFVDALIVGVFSSFAAAR